MFVNAPTFAPSPRRRGLLSGPAAGCLGWIHVGGNYSDAGPYLDLTADDTGKVWRIMPPAATQIRAALGPADRVVINAYAYGSELWDAEGWGRERIFRIVTMGPDPSRCPAGTAAAGAPPAQAPGPLPPAPSSGPDQWAAVAQLPTGPLPAAPPVTTAAATTAATTTAGGTVTTTTAPSYGPILPTNPEPTGDSTTLTVAPLNLGMILVGAALFVLFLARDRR